MDDTIVLWEIPVEKVWESAILRFSGELGGLKPEELYKAIRKAGDWFWRSPERHREGRLDLPRARRIVAKLAFAELGRNDISLAEKIADAYSTERELGSSIEPGTTELLKNLRRQGIKLGMITNGASVTQRAKINRYNLEPLFDHILIEGEFECGKPDERVF
jgi:putative hydrolase of the HAD superfamily